MIRVAIRLAPGPGLTCRSAQGWTCPLDHRSNIGRGLRAHRRAGRRLLARRRRIAADALEKIVAEPRPARLSALPLPLTSTSARPWGRRCAGYDLGAGLAGGVSPVWGLARGAGGGPAGAASSGAPSTMLPEARQASSPAQPPQQTKPRWLRLSHWSPTEIPPPSRRARTYPPAAHESQSLRPLHRHLASLRL